MKKLCLFLCFVLGSHIASAQALNNNPLKTRIDSIVHQAALAYFKDNNRVGFSLGFIANQRKYQYHYGETAPGSGVLPGSKSIYEIGSITKTFTGILVAHAVKEGKMDLKADIRKYLSGNFPNLQYPNGDPIKLIYILAHVAKLPNSFVDDPSGKPFTESYFLNQLHNIKLDSLKEFKYAYSNVGYQLVGYMLEQVYQMSFDNLVQKYITKPLKMTHTKVSYPTLDEPQLLKGFNSTKTEAKSISAAFPAAGALRSTLPDMLYYLNYQMIAKDPIVKFTHKITSGDIDQGAHAIQWATGKLWNWDYYLQTDGGTYGFRSFCMIYPDDQLSFIILTNQTDNNAGGGLYRITATIYNELKKQRAALNK